MRLKRCRHGVMLYNINDMYVGRSLDLYGEYSEHEVAMFRQILRPGMVTCDIGANVGCHTVFMAKVVGPKGVVVAFEPQRIVFQTLCANLALNALENVRTYHAAAGAKPGEIIVPAIRYDNEGNFGGVALGNAKRGEMVPVMTLDALPFGNCHFIKIDVEGMENAVLEGAQETIEKLKPVLYVENNRQEHSKELIQRLFSMDYRLYWHRPPLFNPKNFFESADNVFGRIISRNMLCLPANYPLKVNNLEAIATADVRY